MLFRIAFPNEARLPLFAMFDPSVEPVRAVLQRHPAIRQAVIFGSVAKGSARPDSDLDLAVSAGRPLGTEEKRVLIGELAEATGRPIDLIDLATVGEPLLGQILTHGKRVLSDDDAYADLLLRHLYAQADFVPYRDRILKERREAWIGD